MTSREEIGLTAMQIRIDPDAYVLVTIPRSLEASARVAIAGLYQPFFVEWTDAGIVLVTRTEEWERVAGRFPGAVVEKGFRLISLGLAAEGTPDPSGPPTPGAPTPGPPAPGPYAPPELSAVLRRLTEREIRVRALRSFYRDHLLLFEADLPAAVAILTGEETTSETPPGAPPTAG